MFNAGEPIDREGTEFRVVCANAVAAEAKAKVRTEICFLVMKIPPGRRGRGVRSLRGYQTESRVQVRSVLPRRETGVKERFVTLRIAPYNTYNEAQGLCGELPEHHPPGVGDAARPPDGNVRAGFPGAVRLRRTVGAGRRGYWYRSVFRIDTAGFR